MRLATWNLRHGRPLHGFASNRRLAATVAGLRLDLLATQEVDRRVIRSWFADQSAVVARAAGAADHVFAPARRLAIVGEDGVALAARGRIVDHRTETLPAEGREQRRVALVARVVLAGSSVPISVVTTHLHNQVDVALVQLDRIVALAVALPAPRVVLGDLNLQPDQVEGPLAAAGLSLVDGPFTEPADVPRQRIDHVAVDGVTPAAIDVPAVPVSDHRPFVVETVG